MQTPVKMEKAHESDRSAPQELRKSSANRHDKLYEKSIDRNQRPSNKIVKLGSSNRPYSNSSHMSNRPKQKNPNIVRQVLEKTCMASDEVRNESIQK